jgi:predicted permease
MNALLSDIRYGLRMLRKSPGFTAVALLTLALGVGANTTIFSVVNAVFLTPLSYPASERLVNVWETHVSSPADTNIVSAPNYADWQKQNHVFESMALFDSAGRGYNLAGEKDAERVHGLRVSAGLFTVLGVAPYLGRPFLPENEALGKDHEVVLSYALWQRRYGADPAIVGKTIRVDGQSYTVVAVMPPNFSFEFFTPTNQLWVPIGYNSGDRERGSHSFGVVARLKPGVTLAEAKAEMETIGRRLARQYPTDNVDESATVTPLGQLGVEWLRRPLTALLAAVGFVMLIACVNVANLLLARGAARQKEMAIRLALGAGQARIARQLLTESMMLALLGGAVGLLVATWGLTLLERMLPSQLQFIPMRHLDTIRMDGRVLGFALLVSCVTGVLFGLAPAWHVLRADVSDPLKNAGGRGITHAAGHRLRHGLVAAEVALAVVVVTGAALMIQSMARVLRVNPGFDPKNVLTMDLTAAQKVLYYGPPVHTDFCRRLREEVGAVAGVVSVGSISHLPIGGGNAGRGFAIEGRPDPGAEHQPGAGYSVACPDYFRTMGIPLVQGREFNDQDTTEAPGVIVINQAMARRFWPNEDPVGKRIKLGHYDSKEPWLTIVGVAGDVRHWGLDQEIKPEFFRAYPQAGWPWLTVVAKTLTAPASLVGPIKKALTKVDPEQPVSGVETMEAVVYSSTGSRRMPMVLLIAFGTLALLLSAIGIAGVVSYSVAQRTHEIGIRMALGAQSQDVLRLVIGRSMGWAMVGVVIGVVGSFAQARLISGMLFQVKATDPAVLTSVAVLLGTVALLATYLPARRATKVHPIIALRYE